MSSGTLGAHFVLSKWYTNRNQCILYADLCHTFCTLNIYFMQTMSILCAHFVQTVTWAVPICGRVVGASVDGRRMALRLGFLEVSGKVSRSTEFGRNRAYGVGTACAPKRVEQGIFRDLGGTNPKTTGRIPVDWAVLGTCQRSSLLTQTYGKSAGMVWGRRDQLYDILILSVHVNISSEF